MVDTDVEAEDMADAGVVVGAAQADEVAVVDVEVRTARHQLDCQLAHERSSRPALPKIPVAKLFS